jgi:hypothetical protein
VDLKKWLVGGVHSTAPVIDEYCAWKIIFCVYTMVSLNTSPFLSLNQKKAGKVENKNNLIDFSAHQQWNCGAGWKNTLNNLRLILQPILVLKSTAKAPLG